MKQPQFQPTPEMLVGSPLLIEITLKQPSLWKLFDAWLCELNKPWIDAILILGDKTARQIDHFMNFYGNCLVMFFHLSPGLIRLLWDHRDIPIRRHLKRPLTSDGSYNYCNFTGKAQSIDIVLFASYLKTMTILLHEFGHKVDLGSLKRHTYGNSRGGHWSQRRKKEEKRAWMRALDLSKKYNIPMDVSYATKCLGSYETKSARLGNLLGEWDGDWQNPVIFGNYRNNIFFKYARIGIQIYRRWSQKSRVFNKTF